MQLIRPLCRIPRPALYVVLALSCLTFMETVDAGEDPYAGTTPDQPRYRTHETYSSHAPGITVNGRFNAGPCVGAARLTPGAAYEPGVDAHGNVVVSADLSSHAAIHWAGPSLRYLAQRAPSAIENRYALVPRDYVTVDGQNGSIYYNDYPLRTASEIPPPPPPCL